jgi:hypothetical protein
MNVKFSEVPVGKEFEYKGQTYIRHTHNRGKQVNGGIVIFTKFPKHRIVTEK